MNDCQYCKKTFVSPGTLKHHQKTVKYCIKIQKELNIKVETEMYDCIKCQKSFGEKCHLNRHLLTCKKIKESAETNKNQELELEQLKLELKLKDYEILKLNQKLLILETETKAVILSKDELLKEYKEKVNKFEDIIAKIAETPTTTINNKGNTTTTNNTLELNVLNLTQESINKTIEEKYTEQHLFEGQKGLATFFQTHMNKDADGKNMATITDTSRGVVKYKDKTGALIVDYKGTKLIQMINKPIQKKSKDVCNNVVEQFNIIARKPEATPEEFETSRIRSEKAVDGWLDIKHIDEENEGFMKEWGRKVNN